MIELDLSRQETLILIETLESVISDLRMEIAGTDRKDFRDMLHDRKAALMKTLETLREQA